MSIASLKMIPEDMRTSIIRIYSYQDKNPVGVFYNLYFGKGIAFGNLTSLLLLMEELMDGMNFPQATVQNRRFAEQSKKLERVSMEQQLLPRPDQEAIATFKVNVLFRQGASWQGKLSWMEGKEEKSFRSVLEMVKLMDSALPQPKIYEHKIGNKVSGVG